MRVRRINIALAIPLLVAVLNSPARSEIALVMSGWNQLPQVVVTKGRNQDCGQNPVVFSGSMVSGQTLGPYPDAGSRGLDVCWRRTADPLNSNSGLQTFWTRCSGDGRCVIN